MIDQEAVLGHALAESANECERLRRELKDARAEVAQLRYEKEILEVSYEAVRAWSDSFSQTFQPEAEKVAE